MKLKKEEHIDRIIFLKLFTFEILKNIHKRSEKKKNIEKERVKQRISHILSKNHNKENEDNITKFIKKNYPIQRKSNNLSIIDKGEDKTKLKKIKVNKPPPQEMIDMSGMNKINDLFRDKTILSIECRGPGKDLLIKRYNQINIVKVMLSPSEINGVIDYFSRRSRIPVVDGILKVAVDDMIIAAVTSDLVGSKFIINKNSPYTILAK